MNDLSQFDCFTLERSPLRLLREFEVINLTAKQLETLSLLVSARGEIVPKERFFDVVWKNSIVEDGNLTQTVFLLRKAMGKRPDGGEYIETVPRQGYRLAPVALASVATHHRPAEVNDPVRSEISPVESISAVNGAAEVKRWSSRILPRAMVRLTPYVLIVILTVMVSLELVEGVFAHKLVLHPMLLRSASVTSDGFQKASNVPLLLNGDYLYVNESNGEGSSVAQYDTSGHFIIRISPPLPNERALSLVHRPYGIVFGVPSEPSVPLSVISGAGTISRLDGLSARTLAVSPDGTTMAVIEKNQLILTDQAGSVMRIVTTLPEVAYWPAWSPDGQHIRITQRESDNRQTLWDIDVANGTKTPLLEGSPHEHMVCCGSWTSNGKYFVYVVDEGYRSSLWIRKEMFNLLHKENEWELASGPVDFWTSPTVSSDDKHLYAIGSESQGESTRLKAGPNGSQQPLLEGLSADTVVFSRNNQWIAYTLFPEGSLWRSRPDGSERLQLSKPGTLTRSPQWSPDGSSLVYLCSKPGELWEICSISADGLVQHVIKSNANDAGIATFGTDSKRVVYGDAVDPGLHALKDIYIRIKDIESGDQQKIEGSEGFWNARWSPDGRYIAATAADDQGLMLYDFKTNQWSKLSSLPVNDLIWRQDSKAVLFDTQSGIGSGIFSARIADRRVDKYLDVKGIRRTGFLPWHLSVTPNDEPVVLQQTGTNEVYRLDVDLP